MSFRYCEGVGLRQLMVDLCVERGVGKFLLRQEGFSIGVVKIPLMVFILFSRCEVEQLAESE